uniref:Fibrinogen C-terminal domain-containing protein n=1 Tax=Steinernema glaseri TaxID=37863 RepID=A0A1I8A377_9BILA
MRLTNAFLLWLLCFFTDRAARGEAGDVFTPEWVKKLSECKMDEFCYNFFHAVGCRGFIRVPMKGWTLKQMNKKIDEILRDQDDEECVPRGYSSQGGSLFSDTFVAFPPIDQWNKLGDGYEYEEYEQQEDKSGMICDPKSWFYDLGANNFTAFGCGWNNLIPWTDPLLGEEARMGLTVAEYENITKSRDDLYIASSYDGQALRSYRFTKILCAKSNHNLTDNSIKLQYLYNYYHHHYHDDDDNNDYFDYLHDNQYDYDYKKKKDIKNYEKDIYCAHYQQIPTARQEQSHRPAALSGATPPSASEGSRRRRAHLFAPPPEDESEPKSDLQVVFDDKDNLVYDIGSEVEER